MGIDFSKFTHDIQAKIKAALEDTKSPDKIDAAEFRAMNLEREIANQLMQELAGNMEYIGDGYIKVQNKNKTLILLDKPENNSVIPLTKDSLEYYQELYPDKNIKKGVYNDGVLYLADEQGKPVKDNFGNYICEKISIKEYKSETEEVNGSFEIIENEPAERTNRRFAAALVRSMYNEVIQELETVVAQMGVLDAGLWREAVGMGIQAIADLKKDQELITATTVAKIKRIEKERDNICDSLNELLDSPAEFETKFYQLFGKDYKDNAFQELREIQHNQENKASAEKFRECVSKFNELFPENNISKNIEGWGGSADYQKTVDNIANIVVMFVMTGEIGKLLQGSSQAMAKNILLAAAKGDRKAVFANFAKLAPEVQTVWKSLAKKEFGVALTQTVTPMTQSAATMGSWEGVKAFLNNLTNAEEMSPEELLSRTLEGLKSGAEMGVVMGSLETFAIAPVISKMTPALNKLSGAASEVSCLIEKGNGTVSMEKVMETFTKANEALKGKIVKEGAHTVVALPVLTAGFTVTDTAFHFDEEEFRKSLLDAASTEEEREAVRKMNSFDLRLEFAKNDFAEQVKGMATIEGVGIIFRRLQAGRVAAKTFKNNTPDILSANLREVRENGKISYEICTKEGDVLPIKSGDKNITRFSSIEQATAAYGALCTGLYAELAGMMSDKKYDNQLTPYDVIGNEIFEIRQKDLAEKPEKIAMIKSELEKLSKTEPEKAAELQIIYEMFTNPADVKDVTDAQIDAVVNYLNAHYDSVEKYLSAQAGEIGISDEKLGRFGHRIKGEWSTRDKIANYIKDSVIKEQKAKEKGEAFTPRTLLDAYNDVRDKYASRTVFEKSDYSKHAEIVKILEDGNYSDKAYRKAILRAAELQSQPAVDMLKEAMRKAVKEGKDLSMLRISNYTSEGGIPIFSEAQLAELEDCGVELGIDVSFIKLASEANPMSNKMIVEGATTKAQPSGYTALQVNFVTKAGEIIEWQYRGEFVNKFAEAEHLPYDLRTGKHPWRQYPELETLYKPIADLLDEKSMPKHAYKQLNKYFTDYYVHLRKLELGFESKEPMLEDYEHYKAKDENGIEKEYTFKFDKRLCAKNLEILHEYGEKIKDKSISPEEALKEYNAEVGHVELQYELPETADLARELKKVDNIDDFRAIQTKIDAMEGGWDKVRLMQACFDKYKTTFKQADSPKTFEEFLEQAPKERLSIEETDRIAEREFKFSKDSIKMLKKELGNDYTKIIGFLHAGTKIMGKTSELTPEALVEVYKSEQFAFEVKILSNVDIKTLEYMQKELGFEDLKDTLESVMDMFGRGGEDYIKEFQKCYEINRAIGMSFKDIKNLRSIESSKFVSVTPGQVKAANLIDAIYGIELNATEVLSISNPELITPEFLKDLCETEKRFDEMGISTYSSRDPVEHLKKLKSYEAQLKELGMDFKWYKQTGADLYFGENINFSDLETVFRDGFAEQKNKFFKACSAECKNKFRGCIIDFSGKTAAKKYPAEFAEMLNALALIDCGSSNRVIWDFSNKVHADFSLADIKGVTGVAKAFAELGSFPADGSFATFMLKDYVTDKPNYQAMAKFIRELKEFYADSEYTVNDYMQEVWRGGCFEKMESSFKELKELGLYGKIAPGDLMFLLEDGYKDEVFQKVVNLHDNPLMKGKLMLYRDMPDDLLAERSKKIIELIDAQNSELTNLTLDEKIYINRKYNENLISKLLGNGCFNENYTERLNFCDVKGIVKKIINDTSDGLNIEERCRKLDEAYKLRTFYVDAKTDNIYDLHQQLIKDALANKDLLKSGLEDITDEQIVKTVNHGHAVQTIDLIGLGNTEAAFPLMLDEFDEFMHEISGLYGKLSGDSKECLLKKVNPEQTIDYKFLMAEIKDLKHKLNKAVGAENLKKIKSIQAKKAKIDEQIKQLKQGEKADTPEIKQQIKELQKQSKALGGQAQAIYYSCENAALVKEIMKNISESQKKAKKFLQENSSGLEPQEIVTKLRVLSALSNITTTKELDGFIEMIKPSTPENDMIWNEAVNRKIYEKLGVEYDEALSQKLDLIHCKYISKLFISSEDFFDNMKKLVETIKDNPDLTVEQAIDQLPQNIETKRMFEELGFDFEKYTKIDKNSYTRVEIKLNAEEAKQASIHNLEEDLNDALFQSLPKEVTEPIFKQLKEKLGVTFEKSQKDNWVGDGFSAGSTEYYRLFKDGKPITFEDMDDIVSLIKKEVIANDFWTTKHNDPQIDTARGTMYTHLIKMRTAEVDNATTIKDGETAEIEIRKTDMYDIKKALGLGNDAQCCTALGRNFNEWSAPTYIMNKCIGAIELTDKGSFVGNTMIYLAYVDGKPALILDNIELKTKYQNNDKIRDAFMDYAKKLCAEIGQPDLPIYAGPNRHKLTMDIYPKAKHSMEIIGSSGEDEVYVDYDAQGHVVGSGDRPIIEMYKIR